MSNLHKENELKLIKEIAQSKNGQCVSEFYINNSTKLYFKCKEGHEWWATPSKIKIGRWCPECGGSKLLTIALMKKIAAERGGKCLSKEYINGKTKLHWQCEKGHEWWATPSSIKNQGSWCQKCHGNFLHNIHMMNDIAKSRGGKCLSDEYVNNSTDLIWECSDGHKFKSKPNKIISGGSWCPECSSSLGERICRVLFEQVFDNKFPKAFPEWLVNEDGNKMEIDGYCPDLKLAFEHQGEQHYSLKTHFIKSTEKLKRRIRDDKQKETLTKSNNINLVAFPEIQIPVKIKELKTTLESLLIQNGVPLPKDFHTKEINIDRAYVSGNLEELFNLAKLKGGQYCEKVYKGSLEPVMWKCSCGNKWLATSASIKSGSWCPVCSYKDRAEAKRHSIEVMHKIAKKNGGKCLSTEHINTQTKLLWECKESHQWEATPGNVLAGKWCPKCSGTEKLTIEGMTEIAKLNGGLCLSSEYLNSRTKLKWQCDKRHTWEATPSMVKNGYWCRVCAGNEKPTLSTLNQIAIERNGTCLSDKYVGSGANYKWKCANDHVWLATYDNIKKGTWCKTCSLKNAGQKRRLSIDEMKKIAGKKGGKCLSLEYTNSQTKLLWECNFGHRWEATPSNIKNGRWCPTCAMKKKINKNAL